MNRLQHSSTFINTLYIYLYIDLFPKYVSSRRELICSISKPFCSHIVRTKKVLNLHRQNSILHRVLINQNHRINLTIGKHQYLQEHQSFRSWSCKSYPLFGYRYFVRSPYCELQKCDHSKQWGLHLHYVKEMIEEWYDVSMLLTICLRPWSLSYNLFRKQSPELPPWNCFHIENPLLLHLICLIYSSIAHHVHTAFSQRNPAMTAQLQKWDLIWFWTPIPHWLFWCKYFQNTCSMDIGITDKRMLPTQRNKDKKRYLSHKWRFCGKGKWSVITIAGKRKT